MEYLGIVLLYKLSKDIIIKIEKDKFLSVNGCVMMKLPNH